MSPKTAVPPASAPPLAPADTTGIELAKHLAGIVELVLAHTDKTGRQVAELFIELPDRDDYPDYYVRITSPIAINMMQASPTRCLLGGLKDWQTDWQTDGLMHMLRRPRSRHRHTTPHPTFGADFALMVANAQTYNVKKSPIVRDALSLMALVDAKLLEIFGLRDQHGKGDESQSPARTDGLKRIQEHARSAMDRLVLLRDASGELLAGPFMELPDSQQHARFYAEIKMPMSLSIIRQRIEKRHYRAMADVEADVQLIASNAQQYYGEGSTELAAAREVMTQFQALSRQIAQSDGHGDVPAIPDNTEAIEQLSVNGDVFVFLRMVRTGDFVHITNPDVPDKPRLLSKSHNTRFHEKEVLKTSHFETYFADEIGGRCWVQHLRDFVRGKPVDAPADLKGVYMVEYKYNENSKQNTKIRNWAMCLPESVRQQLAAASEDAELDLYPVPLVVQRNVTLQITETGAMQAVTVAAATPAPKKLKREADVSGSVDGTSGDVDHEKKSRRVSQRAETPRKLGHPYCAGESEATTPAPVRATQAATAVPASTPVAPAGTPGVVAPAASAQRAPPAAAVALTTPATLGTPATPSLDTIRTVQKTSTPAAAPLTAKKPAAGSTGPTVAPALNAGIGANIAATVAAVTATVLPGGPQTAAGTPKAAPASRPQYIMTSPSAAAKLSARVVDAFDGLGDGKLKWFAAPPVDVVSREPAAARRKLQGSAANGSHDSLTAAVPADVEMEDATKPDTQAAGLGTAGPVANVLLALAQAWAKDASSLLD
ncbi:hypothetical protein BC831DRAFT_472126 [Entophlyctis helioformis]|nr:hypothetical protein BC831DRAFT_472126 [Entophlyctis helioformis]